jgi:hypothetical protein
LVCPQIEAAQSNKILFRLTIITTIGGVLFQFTIEYFRRAAGRQFGWLWMDLVMGLVDTVVIMKRSWSLVRTVGAVLLDASPDPTLLLIAAGSEHPRWLETGCSMVVVDTLVHAFLHRTGILRGLAAEHPYGPTCYQPGKCAEIITAVTQRIDARQFNPTYPAAFPRFVQKAIWTFCAQDELNVCNGNRIDDSRRCENIYCQLFAACERIPLGSSDGLP